MPRHASDRYAQPRLNSAANNRGSASAITDGLGRILRCGFQRPVGCRRGCQSGELGASRTVFGRLVARPLRLPLCHRNAISQRTPNASPHYGRVRGKWSTAIVPVDGQSRESQTAGPATRQSPLAPQTTDSVRNGEPNGAAEFHPHRETGASPVAAERRMPRPRPRSTGPRQCPPKMPPWPPVDMRRDGQANASAAAPSALLPNLVVVPFNTLISRCCPD